jgi:hypothetical protein
MSLSKSDRDLPAPSDASTAGRRTRRIVTPLRDLTQQIDFHTTALTDGLEHADDTEVTALLAAAVRLYAAICDGPANGPSIETDAVSPTEAVSVAAALLRAHHLSTFEFQLWYGAGAQATQQ